MASSKRVLDPDMAAAEAEGRRLREERRARVEAYAEQVTQEYLQVHTTLAPATPTIPPATRHVHEGCLRDVQRTDHYANVVTRQSPRAGVTEVVTVTTPAELVAGRWQVRGGRGSWTDRWCTLLHVGVES